MMLLFLTGGANTNESLYVQNNRYKSTFLYSNYTGPSETKTIDTQIGKERSLRENTYTENINFEIVGAYNFSKDTSGKPWNALLNGKYVYKRILIKRLNENYTNKNIG